MQRFSRFAAWSSLLVSYRTLGLPSLALVEVVEIDRLYWYWPVACPNLLKNHQLHRGQKCLAAEGVSGWRSYRDDYTPHGHAVCASLQRLGGPPCPTRAEGVRIACERVREAFLLAGHRPASLLAPNSKKRCVPMTGKQQCERVPGGCGRA